MNTDDLHLGQLPLSVAQTKAIEILNTTKTKKDKLNHLIRDIQRARTSREVERIMWNTFMAGTGFGTVNSPWQNFHKSI